MPVDSVEDEINLRGRIRERLGENAELLGSLVVLLLKRLYGSRSANLACLHRQWNAWTDHHGLSAAAIEVSLQTPICSQKTVALRAHGKQNSKK